MGLPMPPQLPEMVTTHLQFLFAHVAVEMCVRERGGGGMLATNSVPPELFQKFVSPETNCFTQNSNQGCVMLLKWHEQYNGVP